MENVIFLIIRRMRTPLLALVFTYAVAVLGMALIPGQDAAGNPTSMGFFNAFYVVSYTATTIGFGEIPHEFNDAQRLWTILCIYATVIVWFYSLGTLIALLQDKNFKRAFTELKFARRVRRRREPFYLVCGYGEAGTALVRSLTDGDYQAVTIDIDEDRIDLLKLENLRQYVPALCGDARRPEQLIEAGLKHPLCAGVVALTNVNETNLKIAISAKLIRPELKVICRADSHDVEDNMASFGTDHIYDPFDIFALYLATAIQAPCLTHLYQWLPGLPGDVRAEPIRPPSRGLWVLCGYGRFGKALYERLRGEGLELIVIEKNPIDAGVPGARYVTGRGTEAVTLEEADIHRAVGLVAGTDDDANNLSIVMTAKDLNSDLFVIARQNQLENQGLFEAVGAQIVMHPSSVVADRIRVLLGTPLLIELEGYARHQDDAWACQLLHRINTLLNDEVPQVWEISIDEDGALAVWEAMSRGVGVTLGHLLRDPGHRDRSLPALPLLLQRSTERQLLPKEQLKLREGDRLLLCGRSSAQSRMEWTLQNINALRYILTGDRLPDGALWRWMSNLAESWRAAARSR